ncbi:(2Fe-2S)-binding protein [uncultured Jatrophihabitans sp.]|uniref:(2Fe-2S)-binding protein n=1 Tax=uncultured Jatrophihabitans sp. TaxID=1610747 RepID=UPI0035C99C12
MLDEFGPFFAVATHGDERPSPPWRPLGELIDDRTRLDARVAKVRAALARHGDPEQVERRVAVSVAHLGLIARLLAPQLAADVLGRGNPSCELDKLWWQDVLGGPFPLSAEITGPTDVPDHSLTGTAAEQITQSFAHRYAIAPRVLWGNVGSAVNSAARQMASRRPELADTVMRAADRLLGDPRVDDGLTRAGAGFRRRSCCLIYRLARSPSASCGDCVLRR